MTVQFLQNKPPVKCHQDFSAAIKDKGFGNWLIMTDIDGSQRVFKLAEVPQTDGAIVPAAEIMAIERDGAIRRSQGRFIVSKANMGRTSLAPAIGRPQLVPFATTRKRSFTCRDRRRKNGFSGCFERGKRPWVAELSDFVFGEWIGSYPDREQCGKHSPIHGVGAKD